MRKIIKETFEIDKDFLISALRAYGLEIPRKCEIALEKSYEKRAGVVRSTLLLTTEETVSVAMTERFDANG